MTQVDVAGAARVGASGYKVDVSRGQRIGRVSSEWFSRPADERYLSLDDLFQSVCERAERSHTRTVESAAIQVEASRDDSERLALRLPGSDILVAPTHWSFGQLAGLVGAPATYLRQLPAPLAGINLQYGLTSHRAEQVKTLEIEDGRIELRAVTGPDYGRIYDHELVAAVQKIAGNGVGDTRWKVPGVLDWGSGIYNPRAGVTEETTTLYASDRDVFLFLVDDLNPIEAGRLPDGSPDLYFRGFYAWNSEVGAKTLGIASFYLRAVCQNRNLWGVEDFQEIAIRHSKFAANRFAHEAAPALTRFADASPMPFVNGVRAARERIVARTDKDRGEFLKKRGFSKAETTKIIETVLAEEGHPPAIRRPVRHYAQSVAIDPHAAVFRDLIRQILVASRVVARVGGDLFERSDREVEGPGSVCPRLGERSVWLDDPLAQVFTEGVDGASEHAGVVEPTFDRVFELVEVVQVEHVGGRQDAPGRGPPEREHLVPELDRMFGQCVGEARKDVGQALLDVLGFLILVGGLQPNGQLVVSAEQVEGGALSRDVGGDRPLVEMPLLKRKVFPEIEDPARGRTLAVRLLLIGEPLPFLGQDEDAVLSNGTEVA